MSEKTRAEKENSEAIQAHNRRIEKSSILLSPMRLDD
jgi:hypothetical protein